MATDHEPVELVRFPRRYVSIIDTRNLPTGPMPDLAAWYHGSMLRRILSGKTGHTNTDTDEPCTRAKKR